MDKTRKNLLVFGYGLSVIIPTLVFFHARKHGLGPISTLLLCAAGVILMITIIKVEAIKPFYDRWMKVAHFIGTIITAIILSILFYFVFGVAGIILRIMRKDLLDEKLEPQKSSYWTKLPVTKFDKVSYQRQF